MIEYSPVIEEKIKKISAYLFSKSSEDSKEKDQELPSLWVCRNAFLTLLLTEFRRQYLSYELSQSQRQRKLGGHYKELVEIIDFSPDSKAFKNLISEVNKILLDYDADFFIHQVFEYILKPNYEIPGKPDDIEALIQFSLIYYVHIVDRVPWAITAKMDFLVMKLIYHIMAKMHIIVKAGKNGDRTFSSTKTIRTKKENEQRPKILKAWQDYKKEHGSNLKNKTLHQISHNIAKESGYSINTVKTVLQNHYLHSISPWKISSKRNDLVNS